MFAVVALSFYNFICSRFTRQIKKNRIRYNMGVVMYKCNCIPSILLRDRAIKQANREKELDKDREVEKVRTRMSLCIRERESIFQRFTEIVKTVMKQCEWRRKKRATIISSVKTLNLN